MVHIDVLNKELFAAATLDQMVVEPTSEDCISVSIGTEVVAIVYDAQTMHEANVMIARAHNVYK